MNEYWLVVFGALSTALGTLIHWLLDFWKSKQKFAQRMQLEQVRLQYSTEDKEHKILRHAYRYAVSSLSRYRSLIAILGNEDYSNEHMIVAFNEAHRWLGVLSTRVNDDVFDNLYENFMSDPETQAEELRKYVVGMSKKEEALFKRHIAAKPPASES